MGNLFPDSDEYPDHQPVPSAFPWVRLVSKGTIAPVAVTLAVYALCPEHHDWHAHALHQDATNIAYPAFPFNSIGSTSANSFVPSSTSANDEARRQRYALRETQTRIAGALALTYPSSTGG